jgi:hypothetical protein
MLTTKAELKRRAAIRKSRNELVKMMQAAHRFRKLFKDIGTIVKVEPVFPPPFPQNCGPIRGTKIGPPKPITKRQFDKGIAATEVQMKKAIRVFDKMCLRRPRPGR